MQNFFHETKMNQGNTNPSHSLGLAQNSWKSFA